MKLSKTERYLSIELPDDVAVVDFIDKALVEMKLEDDKLYITVKATHGLDASSWDLHEYEIELPKQEDEEE